MSPPRMATSESDSFERSFSLSTSSEPTVTNVPSFRTLGKTSRQWKDNTYSHAGFRRTYERIVENFYMRHLTRRLRRYVFHYPEFRLNQIKRHKPYGIFQPILTPPLSFHTITLDFIMALLKLDNGFNCMISVTY